MTTVMYRVTAHLPIDTGAGVVEIHATSGLFGGPSEKHTLPAPAACQLASDLLTAAALVDAYAATEQVIDDDIEEN